MNDRIHGCMLKTWRAAETAVNTTDDSGLCR